MGLDCWPGAIDPAGWKAVFGREPRGVLVLADPQVGETHGQLRSVALLRALGVTRFTFASGWRGLELVPYEWRYVGPETTAADLAEALPLCQVVSQDIENTSPGDAVFRVLSAQRRAGPESLVVYVFDSETFSRRLDPQVRSFVDEHNLMRPMGVDAAVRRYEEWRGIRTDSTMASANLVLRGLARFMLPGRGYNRLEWVVNPANHTAASPLWDLYAHLCDVVGPDGDTRTARDILREWVDDEITRTVNEVVRWLGRFDYRRDQVMRERENSVVLRPHDRRTYGS